MKQSSPLAWIRNLEKGSEEAQSQSSQGRKVTFAVPSGRSRPSKLIFLH